MDQRIPRARWIAVWCLAVLWIGLIVGRLSYLQLYRYSDYLGRAQRQQQHMVEVNPERGTIYDRRGRELAVSIPMDDLVADPGDVKDAAMVARLLSRVIEVPAEEIERKLNDASEIFPLARKLTPEQAARVGDLNLRGIYTQKENHRVYPQHDLAAHVLGFVDVDEHGLGGIELELDKMIRGRPGHILVQSDARRRWFDRSEVPGIPGTPVTLTIDETIQYIAEKELARAIAETHAQNGVIVVQDPNTGELLAVANWPTFDPNDAGKFPDESRIDRAVASAYEPGSTFKVITLGGAIEDGVVKPTDMVDCQMGSIVVAGRLIHDHKPFGVISVQHVLEVSSDVGAIKVALRQGEPRFFQTIRRFHFGELTGIELPGENRGLFRRLEDWTPSSIGSLAMGQEISVTPVQMVSAISAIANGGTVFRPRVVKSMGKRSGALENVSYQKPLPTQGFDADTSASVREMMEGVILNEHGTGKTARITGYTAGGKSGTAQKIDPTTGRYSRNEYVASFTGFAPLNDPAVTILVALDSPVGAHLGGEVAGPVFKRVAEQVLPYMDVGHDVPPGSEPGDAIMPAKAPRKTPAKDLQAAKKRESNGASIPTPPTGARFPLAPQNAGNMTTVEFGGDAGIAVPSFAGATVRGVTEACVKLGLTPILVGNGVAVEQTPEAGARIARGGRVTVRFERTNSGGVSGNASGSDSGYAPGRSGGAAGTSTGSTAGPTN
jgi:cell division protein FtsI (penicillin-binding protein 3)